jgi:hypothetical protein
VEEEVAGKGEGAQAAAREGGGRLRGAAPPRRYCTRWPVLDPATTSAVAGPCGHHLLSRHRPLLRLHAGGDPDELASSVDGVVTRILEAGSEVAVGATRPPLPSRGHRRGSSSEQERGRSEGATGGENTARGGKGGSCVGPATVGLQKRGDNPRNAVAGG